MREEGTAKERLQHIFGRQKTSGEVGRAKKVANQISVRVSLGSKLVHASESPKAQDSGATCTTEDRDEV